jgi:hypothetical protein
MSEDTPKTFYYSEKYATLYFMMGDKLAGMPQYQDGTFGMDDHFIVDRSNTELPAEDYDKFVGILCATKQ